MEKKEAWGESSSEVREAAIKIVKQEEHARYEEDKVDVLKDYQLLQAGFDEAFPAVEAEQPTIPGSSNNLPSPDCGPGGSDAAASDIERERGDKKRGSGAEGGESISKEDGSEAKESNESSDGERYSEAEEVGEGDEGEGDSPRVLERQLEYLNEKGRELRGYWDEMIADLERAAKRP